ncbi:MAG: recombinase family protein [Planctomycetales bacterium]|nr:recombinase family protein [Planctomycetales bacterium]
MPGEVRPLSPKSGDTLRVIALGRISTVYQDVENIAASYRYIESYLGKIYQGPLDITFLGEQASGMRTDRTTIRQAEDLIAGGQIDLVVAEDLSRIYRNPRHQYNFVQDAVDAGTRVILIGDHLDTADENWEVMMGAAALRHGLHIPDTRRRVRRTATHAFHQGGMVQKIRFGYRKLSREEAALGAFGPKGLRIAKVPEHTETIRELARRVIAGESYIVLAEQLNDRGLPPGPYVRSGRWSPRVLVELMTDPILAGVRTFRDTICRPVFRTGRHQAEKNASPETARVPELAHLSETEFESLQRAIQSRRQLRLQKSKPGISRRGITRSRTLWPGQALRCGICGSWLHLFGETLRCSQSTARAGSRCWNHVQPRTNIMRERLVAWLLMVLGRLGDGGRDLTNQLIELERLLTARTDGAHVARENKRAMLRRQAQTLTNAIVAGGELASLVQRLQAVEAEMKALDVADQATRPRSERKQRSSKTDVPQLIHKLLRESYPFADWLRKVISEFVVYPAQALDTPQIRPMGVLRVDLSRLVNDTPTGSAEQPEEYEIPLFTEPQPIRLLEACAALRRDHPQWSLHRIAEVLGVNTMGVKRSVDYARLMAEAGVTKPYRILQEAPIQASRWRRRSGVHNAIAEASGAELGIAPVSS